MPDTQIEQRKLAAIMFTDMVGYSAMMQRNESLAIELVEEQRSLLRSLFAKHGGHEIETIGDAFFVEFGSALHGTRCAIEIQETLHARNKAGNPERKIELRIGLHLGDVVLRDSRIYGDGVNIAARVQPLAEPGGICITREIFDMVKHNLDVKVVSLGPTELKNIKDKFELYSLVVGAMAGKGESGLFPEMAAGGDPRKVHGPSIGVLPFANMSSDPENEYFSDGMSEEIIHALSKIRRLHVASRTSAFSFKGKNEEVRAIGRTLNVSTVLEGSVRKSGNQIRITAQLVNVEDGYHLWSERYDREISDVFEIQDEITMAIVDTLRVTLLGTEEETLLKKDTKDHEAYNLYLKGRYFWNKRGAELSQAVRYFEMAIARDPGYSRAYSGLADSYAPLTFYGYLPPNIAIPKAKAAAEKALSIDPGLCEAHCSLGYVKLFYDRDPLMAIHDFDCAIHLSPSYIPARYWRGASQLSRKRFEEAIEDVRRSVEIEPLSAIANAYLGWAYYFSRRYDEARKQLIRTLELDPGFYLAHWILGQVHEREGRYPEAIAEFEKGADLSSRSTWMLSSLSHAYASAGREDDALQLLSEVTDRAKTEYVRSLVMAYLYDGLKRPDQVLDSVEQAFEEHDLWLAFLPVDPYFEKYHSHPRFANILKKIGL